MMKKTLSGLTVVILSGFCTPPAFAYTGICEAQGGTHQYTFDLGSKDITDPKIDVTGTVIKNAFPFNGGSYTARCDENPENRGPLYVSAVSPITDSQTIDGATYYKLNDYLSFSAEVWIGAGIQDYKAVPFVALSNEGDGEDYSVWQDNFASGGKGRISIRIDRAFVGFSRIDKLILNNYLSSQKDTAMSGSPVSSVYVTGQIDVPQSCELNAGNIVSIDFGNIGASLFAQAGPGNKPEGVNPETRNIAIACKNIDAQATLSLRLEANNVSGNAIVSDNEDLGFIVADKSETPLTPNNIDSNIMFQLDDTGKTTVPITAWPVSTTGKAPKEGKFTAEGYLRVDFD